MLILTIKTKHCVRGFELRPESLLQYFYIYQNIVEQGKYFMISLLASTWFAEGNSLHRTEGVFVLVVSHLRMYTQCCKT